MMGNSSLPFQTSPNISTQSNQRCKGKQNLSFCVILDNNSLTTIQ